MNWTSSDDAHAGKAIPVNRTIAVRIVRGDERKKRTRVKITSRPGCMRLPLDRDRARSKGDKSAVPVRRGRLRSAKPRSPNYTAKDPDSDSGGWAPRRVKTVTILFRSAS